MFFLARITPFLGSESAVINDKAASALLALYHRQPMTVLHCAAIVLEIVLDFTVVAVPPCLLGSTN